MVERTWEVYVETSRKVGPGYQAAGADAEVSNVAPGSTS